MNPNKVFILSPAERAYHKYVKGGYLVIDLIAWFKAELFWHPEEQKKYAQYSDEMLAKHTRHVEYLARAMFDARKLQEALGVSK